MGRSAATHTSTEAIQIPTGLSGIENTRSQISTASPKVSTFIDEELQNYSDLDTFKLWDHYDEFERILGILSPQPSVSFLLTPSNNLDDFSDFEDGYTSALYPPSFPKLGTTSVTIQSIVQEPPALTEAEFSNLLGQPVLIPQPYTPILSAVLCSHEYSISPANDPNPNVQLQIIGEASTFNGNSSGIEHFQTVTRSQPADICSLPSKFFQDEVHLNKTEKVPVPEVPTEIIVDGIPIPVEAWAKAYIEKKIVKAGMILFKCLFPKQEICMSTLSGRCDSVKLDEMKKTALLKAVWWMQNKEHKNPYPCCSRDIIYDYPPPQVVSEIEQKVFVEKRNEIRRKCKVDPVIKRIKMESRDSRF